MFEILSSSIRRKRGFTLIELLIVVAIIAILAAIAIPQFSAYKKRGYNASANSDLRNIRTSEEAINADFQEYGASTATIGGAGTEVGPGGWITLAGGKTSTTNQQSVSLSPNVYAAIKTDTNTLGTVRTAYVAVTTHATGDNYYGADSDVTALYRMGWSGTYAAGQTLTATPASTASADDLSGVSNWTQMK